MTPRKILARSLLLLFPTFSHAQSGKASVMLSESGYTSSGGSDRVKMPEVPVIE